MPHNGDPAFDILVASPSGLAPSQLQIDFSSLYDRVLHPDVDLEGGIEEIFAADYKTFVGTNLSPKWQAFLTCSKEDIERCQHMASPLGNGAIVETKDDCVLVLKRSEHVGEFPGHLVFPGGHSEPQEIGILGHHDLGCTVELNTKITDEMYTGILREIVEETGVPVSTLSDPLFIGVSRRVLNARPTAFFFVKCTLSTPEVLQFYKDAHDKYESTQLLSIAKDDLPSAAAQMPGCHQGGAALFELMRKDTPLKCTHVSMCMGARTEVDSC